MGYLPTIDDDQATGKLREVYEQIKKTWKLKRVPPVWEAFGVRPEVLEEMVRLSLQLTFGGSTLGRRWEEMISTAVSAWNHCHY